ncbi:hypothetical protein [Nocardia sp. alder85J]|uniref:hypothetical protein n=1 Tax=Nocardia sp. alder85J TaxID=2862949 RepID=UPI001CD309CD|nr:hypothetical protein [Nocardia sp. alder85J]MCX4098520.1 hypothetical protein [Nocardia sp. alder85J]
MPHHLADLGRPALLRGLTLTLPAADRAELSAGVRPAAETSCADTYSEGCFVPRAPWRAPTRHERAVLSGTPGPGALPGDWIAVVPVPGRVLAACTELRAASATGDAAAVDALIEGPIGRVALVEALRWATGLTDPARPGTRTPFLYGRTPAGNPTMTTGSHGRRVGLHVDSWDDGPLAERAAAANRVSANLGHRDRYLLFVNAPLRVMAAALRERDLLDGAADPRFALGQRFMTVFPRYPVTRLVVHPGEAYIAPTDNMLHDGYAEPHGQIDVQFSCRGWFVAPG